MRFLMGMMMMNEELSLYEMMCPNRTPPASIIIVELSIKLVAKMCILNRGWHFMLGENDDSKNTIGYYYY